MEFSQEAMLEEISEIRSRYYLKKSCRFLGEKLENVFAQIHRIERFCGFYRYVATYENDIRILDRWQFGIPKFSPGDCIHFSGKIRNIKLDWLATPTISIKN